MENVKKVLWLGVTSLEQGSDRVRMLVDKIGGFRVDFPDTTTGMGLYEESSSFLDNWNVIATDEQCIDKSWEGFFEPKNWGKQIVQFKDNEWTEVMPGFSKNYIAQK